MTARRRRPQGLALTARDDALLAFTGRHGCASIWQLHARFWPGRRMETCRDRLRALVRAGYLGTLTTECRGATEQVVWLTPAGRRLFPADVRADLSYTRPATGEQAHLLRTIDILERLERRVRVVAWTNEHSLKGAKRRTGSPAQAADLAVTIEQDGRRDTVLVEIDGHYYGAMLARKAQELGRAALPVLWVIYSPRRLETIARLCQDQPHVRPILFDDL